MTPRIPGKIAPQARLAFSALALALGSCLWGAGNNTAESVTVAAADFFYGPSPDNTAKIEALLTPTSVIRATKDGPMDGDSSGMVLLDEVVHYVDENGRALRIHQVAYRALTDAGVKTLGEDIFRYRHKQQTFRVVRAETIQPDGKIDTVAREAVLVQSPQRQADAALYDDQAEVRIIYPNVKVGSITRAIIVIDDQIARMPNAYTYSFIWGSGWPTARERLVVDLPLSLAKKLHAVTLGANNPEATRETLPGDRMRLSWIKTSQPKRRYEIARAPASQNGPLVHLTTLGSWDEIGSWFTSLLKERDRLSPSLTAQVEAWTRGLTDRDAIIRVLFTKVANDVRYTGLALGDADYQPYPCEEVWAKRYGDCKDKACLLVSFLRAKGIPAHITLLNTDHLGRIDQRAPDFRVFTHAIVAIPDDQGGQRFYDPTISWAEPGVLSPGDADRDVLIVQGDRVKWARTPAQSAGKLAYDFDLKLAASGELTGWLSMTADGFYGAGQRERFRNLDPVERRRAMAETVRGFFSGAEVIDVAAPSPCIAGQADTIKAYFMVPAQGGSPDGTLTLGFPKSASLFFDLGTSNERESPYFLYQDDTTVTAKIALPAGIAPQSLPVAYQIETPTGTAESRWTCAAGMLDARLRLQIRQPVLPASEFPRFYQAMLSLHTWLNQPLSLSGSKEAAAPVKPDAELDMPLMPSGNGQIELVDRLYPYNSDSARRRAALLRTLQYFPNDKITIFNATARLAWLDWNADQNQEALDRLAPLLNGYEHDVTPDLYSWAETTKALALRDLKRTPEAEAILLRITHDSRLTADRRAETGVEAARLLTSHAPDKAIALLLETIDRPSSWLPDAYTLLARIELQNDKSDALRSQLTKLAHAQPDVADDILRAIVKNTARWNEPGDGPRQAALLQLVTTLVPQPGAELKAALQAAQSRQLAQLSFEKIRQQLGESIKGPPLTAWYGRPDIAALTTWDLFKQAIQTAEGKKDADQCTRLSICALLTLPPDSDFSTRLWKAAANADWQERLTGMEKPSPVLPLLLDLCDQLPKTEDGYFEGRYLRGTYLARRKNYQAEHDLFTALANDPQRPAGYRDSAYGRLGGSCEHIGDFAGALTAYANLEKSAADSVSSPDCLLRAAFINLNLDRPDEALRIVQILEHTPENILKKTTGEYNIRELIALNHTGRAKEFWAGRISWWPLWQDMERKLGLPAPAAETIVPVIPELSDLGRELGQAERAKNPALYWQAFRRLQSAARWLPSLAPETGGLCEQACRIAPAQKNPLVKMVLSQLEVPVPMAPDADRRARQIQLAINYHDNGLPLKALDVVAAFRSSPQPDDTVTRAMHRIWGVAARTTRSQLSEASASLAQDLANPEMSDTRGRAVELLADLYRLNGKPDEEAALLARELVNPHIIASTAIHDSLAERQQKLGGSTRLAKQVGEWLRARAYPWYASAEPADLNDPRLRNLDEVLRNPSRLFNAPQVIKLQLLVAQNPGGSIERQRGAFVEAYDGLLRMTVTHEEARQLTDSVLSPGYFDDELRTSLLWSAIFDAYYQNRPADYRQWLAHPLAARFNAYQQKLLPSFTRFIETDKNSANQLKTLVSDFTSRELTSADIGVIQSAVTELIRLGDLESARAVVDGVAGWNIASDVTLTKDSIQLDFSRQLRAAEAVHPVREALQKLAVSRLPALPSEPPAAYTARRQRSRVPVFSRPVTHDTLLYLLRTHGTSPTNLWFWHAFIDSLPPTPESRGLAYDLIKTALAAAPDDAVRAEVVATLPHSLDYDEPDIRTCITALIASYAQPEAPLTTAQIRLDEINVALRLGQPVDLPAAFELIQDPDLKQTRDRLMLRHYTQTRDLVMLKRTVDGLGASQLLAPSMLEDAIPALELLGRKSDVSLARGTAQREMKNAILEAWAGADPSDVSQSVDLAEALGPPSPFPAGWVDSVCGRITSPRLQGRVRLIDAWLRQDWQAAAQAAASLIRDYPAVYHYYWYQGVALLHLGDKPAAIAALTVYTRYSKEESEYPAALSMLKELGGPSEKTGVTTHIP